MEKYDFLKNNLSIATRAHLALEARLARPRRREVLHEERQLAARAVGGEERRLLRPEPRAELGAVGRELDGVLEGRGGDGVGLDDWVQVCFNGKQHRKPV